MNRYRLFLFIIFFLCTFSLKATHQRAGEITYRHLSGLTYEFTLVTYTYTPSLADRPEIDIYWGDGSSNTIYRNEKINLQNDISKNTYITQHTFPSAGTYSITFEDPNRNAGIVNIPNSVNIPFFLETTLTIHPYLGSNSSPLLLNPPIDNGCHGVPYHHNPGAYDPDGDSLSYSLIYCRGYDGDDIPGYSYPDASNFITIDPVSGDLTWDSPTLVGEYNIAILIKEWRQGYMIGSVVRDMQISIVPCNNKPPEIYTIDDTCIIAGTLLRFEVIARDDYNPTYLVNLTATGAPFQVQAPKATFQDVSDLPPVTSEFNWQTDCKHVRLAPYSVLFKAYDNGPHVSLSNYKTVNITIIAPKPENLIAIPIGNNIVLSWDPSICANVSGYRIYKRKMSNPFEPEYCQTGMPSDKGYEFLTSVSGHTNTSYLDDGSIIPTYHGNEYCYRVVAFFLDNAESYVSDEACTNLDNDAPLITHVDVEKTDIGTGEIQIRWTRPPELDTIQFPGPDYEYRIFRSQSKDESYQEIGSTYSLHDTTYLDQGLNTLEYQYFYKVELWNKSDSPSFIETSDIASSVFLKIESLDRALRLSWDEVVPWNNSHYIIYRYNPASLVYDSLTLVKTQNFTDRKLENGSEYCYYISAEGAYYLPDTLAPLINRSQIVCEKPYDLSPPDVPTIQISTDCETVELKWVFPSEESYLDVYKYYIHYKPTLNSPFTIIDSIENNFSDCYYSACEYRIYTQGVITGCFALSAVDSNGNRSALTDSTCFEYSECLDYSLPNIFTPNGDGFNDLFIPFPYSNVEKVSMTIYNRWGRKVFFTEDPDINWDGTDYWSKKPCAEGAYFYSCDVYVPTLAGTTSIPLHGSITLIRGPKSGNN